MSQKLKSSFYLWLRHAGQWMAFVLCRSSIGSLTPCPLLYQLSTFICKAKFILSIVREHCIVCLIAQREDAWSHSLVTQNLWKLIILNLTIYLSEENLARLISRVLNMDTECTGQGGVPLARACAGDPDQRRARPPRRAQVRVLPDAVLHGARLPLHQEFGVPQHHRGQARTADQCM